MFESDEEVRVTDPTTGGEKGQKLARFDLLPVGPLWETARHYGVGADKYDDHNWRKGYAWSLSYAAMQRHAALFWGGESYDPETGTHHMAAVVFHAFALMENDMEDRGTDDRWLPGEDDEPEGSGPVGMRPTPRGEGDEPDPCESIEEILKQAGDQMVTDIYTSKMVPHGEAFIFNPHDLGRLRFTDLF